MIFSKKIKKYIIVFLISVFVTEQFSLAAEKKSTTPVSPNALFHPSDQHRNYNTQMSIPYRSDINEEVFRELQDYILASTNSNDLPTVQVLLENQRQVIWDFYYHFYYMLVSAKVARMHQAYLHRDQLVIATAALVETLKTSNAIRNTLALSIYEWALVSAGKVNLNQRKRLDYILNDFFLYIRELKYLPIYTPYLDPVMGVKQLAAVMTFGLGLSFILGSSDGLNIRDSLGVTLVKLLALALVGLGCGVIVYHLIRKMSSKLRMSAILRTKITDVLDSYKKTYSKIDTEKSSLHRLDSNPNSIVELDLKSDVPASLTKKLGFTARLWRGFNNWLVKGYTSDSSLSKTHHPQQWQPSELTSEILKDFFLDEFPKRKFVQNLFQNADADASVEQRLHTLIAETPELLALAQKGRLFKEAYLGQLQGDFNRETLFVLDPETALLQNLRFLQKTNMSETEMEITLQQAQQKALEDVKNSLGLPEFVDISYLENHKHSSDKWADAYDLYRRKLNIYQQQEILRRVPNQIDLPLFKKRMIDKIIRLRIMNFKKGLEAFIKAHPEQKDLLISTEQGTQRVSLEQLLNSEITFRERDTLSSLLNTMGQRFNNSAKERYYSSKSKAEKVDSPHLSDMHRSGIITPLEMRHTVRIAAGTLDVTLAEESFVNLLIELGPSHFSHKQDKSVSERYLIETSRRDALLADTSSFLVEIPSENAEDLSLRFANKIKMRSQIGSYSKTFSEELRDNPRLIEDSSLWSDLRWSGYHLHPDYWRMRDIDALSFEELTSVRKEELIKSKGRNLSHQEISNIESEALLDIKERKEKRFYSLEDRFEKDVKFVSWIGSALILGASVIGYYNSSDALPEKDSTSSTSSGKDSTSSTSSGKDSTSSTSSGKDSTSSTSSEKDSTSSTSSEKDSTSSTSSEKDSTSSTSSGKDSTSSTSSGKDSTSSSIRFGESDPTNHSKKTVDDLDALGTKNPKFSLNTDLVHMPKYLNFALPSNFPKDLESVEDRSPFIETDISIQHRSPEEKAPVLFELRSNQPLVATGTFLPIPSPSGYRVYNIELSSSLNSSFLSRSEYKVYFNNMNGLSYVRLPKYLSNSAFYVDISYQPITQLQPYKKGRWLLDKKILIKLNTYLKDIGEERITHTVDKLIQSKNSIDVQTLSTAFGSSAIYTYDPERSPWIPSHWRYPGNPFAQYEKFLKDGIFYYQCSGSNTLFKDYMADYYSLEKVDYVAENLSGYTFNSKGQVSPVGHIHTLVRHTILSYQYTELDATPFTMDPKYANEPEGNDRPDFLKEEQYRFRQRTKYKEPEPKKPEPQKPEEKRGQDVAILPSRLTLVVTTAQNTGKHPIPPLSELQQFEVLDKKIKKALLELESNASKNPLSLEHPSLTRAFALTPHFRRYLQSGETKELINQLIRLKHNISPQRKTPDLDRFLAKEYESLLEAHENNHLEVIMSLSKDYEVVIQLQLEKLATQSQPESSPTLFDDTEFRKLYSEFIGFYKKFPEFQENFNSMQNCKAYFH